MSKIDEAEFQGRLHMWLNGDADAVRFCCQLIWLSHLWDDLIDKDNPRTDQEINRAFQLILAELPLNKFYAKHSAQLGPLLASAALQYPVANVLERGTAGEKIMAFAMRNAVVHIVPHCFFLIGGTDMYNRNAGEYYRMAASNLGGLFKDFWEEMQDG